MIPMLSDYCLSSPSAMTKQERDSCVGMRKTWEAIAGPGELDKKRDDPYLFPGHAKDEILEKMPPTIVWEAEFDMFITEATRFAARLKAAGRLLELVVIPGSNHGSDMMPGLRCYQVKMEAFKL